MPKKITTKEKPATPEEIKRAAQKAAEGAMCITLQYTAQMPTKKYPVSPRLWLEQSWLDEILLINHALLVGSGEENKLVKLCVRFTRKQLKLLIKQAQAILKVKPQYTKCVLNKKIQMSKQPNSTWQCVVDTKKLKTK